MTPPVPENSGADAQTCPPPIRIVIADDHQWVREGIRGMIHRPPGMTVVGLAGNSEELEQLVRDTAPDVAVIDHALGSEDGMEAALLISRWCPVHRVLLITAWENPGIFRRAQDAGLGGFLLKKADDELLRNAVSEIAAGRRFFPERYPEPRALRERRRWESLSATEWAIVRALDDTGSPKPAAQTLGQGYSAKTVSNHLQSIYRKLQTSGFRTVIELYRQEGAARDPARQA